MNIYDWHATHELRFEKRLSPWSGQGHGEISERVLQQKWRRFPLNKDVEFEWRDVPTENQGMRDATQETKTERDRV